MNFTFSITGVLKEAWDLFKKHLWFFVGISAVFVILNLLKPHNPFIGLLFSIAAFYWTVLMMKLFLSATGGKEENLSWEKLGHMTPSVREFFGVLGAYILPAAPFIIGALLFFIAFFFQGGGGYYVFAFLLFIWMVVSAWFFIRLSIAPLSFLDKSEGIRKALKTSWAMTKGSLFWTILLVAVVSVLLNFVGALFFGIGIVVTYPLSMTLQVKLYRALSLHHAGLAPVAPVAVQPTEIEAPAPEVHHENETSAQ